MNFLIRAVETTFELVNRLTYRLDVFLRHAMAFLMSVLFLLLTAQVFLRYFIRFPLSWIEELATFTFSYLVLIGFAVCLRAGQHVSMNTLFVNLPRYIQSVLSVGFAMIAIYFAFLMIWSGNILVELGANELTYSGSFSLAWPRLALIIGGILLILNASTIVLAHLAYWLTGEPRSISCGERGGFEV